jgi:hypothetical protein
MSSKFLSSDSATSLASLQDGTFNLSVASASMSDLTPGLPVKTNSDKKLVSGLIEVDEINATLLTNPLVGTLKVEDLETKNYFSVDDELQKIDNFSASTTQVTNLNGRLKAGEVFTDTISDAGGNVFIQLDATDINFSSTNLTWNGQPIGGGGGGGVENPMVSVLDCASNNIVNMGQFNTNMNSFVIATEGSLSDLQTDTSALQAKTIYQTATLNETKFTSSVRCTGSLKIESDTPAFDDNVSTQMLLGSSGVFTIEKMNGLSIDSVLTITDLLKINMWIDLNMRNNDIYNVSKINGLTPYGGVVMSTSDAQPISATTTQTSLFAGATLTPLDGLTVPANTFTISSYHFNMAGNISTNNGDTLTLSLYNGGLLASLVVDLTGSSNEFFELEADFSIRSIGGIGSARISTNFDFTYSDNGATAWRGSRNCTVNTTTFDTTISNTLDVRAQWSSASAANSIQCRQLILTRVF